MAAVGVPWAREILRAAPLSGADRRLAPRWGVCPLTGDVAQAAGGGWPLAA